MTGKIRSKKKGFWSELKRRGVVATTIAYVIGASILVEGTDLVEEILELPAWVPRSVFVLAVLALPLVMLLSWFFNIEREPVDAATDEVTTTKNDRQRVSEEQSLPPSPEDAETSVAILPFEYLSTEEAHRFLAVGIPYELHSIFSKMHRVRVASNTLTYRYAKKDLSASQLAEKLNVERLISGSVQVDGDEMIVIVEFENARTGEQFGSERFRRKLSDLFAAQHEIVNKAALRFAEYRKLDEIRKAAIRKSASNLDAWSLVQRARSFVLGFTPQTLSDAVPLLKQAIRLDPDYSAAHAVLAMVLAEQVLNGLSESPDEDRRLALEAARDAYSVSKPDYFVSKMCGPVWAYFGQSEQSIIALRQAIRLAPYDFGSWGYLGWALVESGKQKDIDELHEVIGHISSEMPDHPGVPYWMYHQSSAFLSEGEYEKAAQIAEESVAMNPKFPWVWMHLANIYGRLEREENANRALQRCTGISPALTPDYYQDRIRDMSDREEFISCRTGGLRSLGLI